MTSESATPPPSNRRVIVGVWVIVLATALLSCGASSALFYLITPLMPRRAAGDALSSNVLFGSVALLGGLFGVVLLWQAINLLRGRASRPAAPMFPRVPFLIIAFLVTILIGIGALALKPVAAYIFPPWHFLAALLPPLAFLAYAARRLGGASGLRALVAAFSWGGLGATSLSLLFELLLGIVAIIILAFGIVLNANAGLIDLRAIEQLLESDTPDVTLLLEWLTNPAIIAGALIFFAGAVPLIEEAVKTLALAFIDPRRTSLAHAMLWGISAGAGFAAVENVFNGGADVSLWALVMLMRVGATVMHVATGVTMGRGWYAARVERRWGKLVIAYGVSVFFHAAWNALAILAGGGALLWFSGANQIDRMMPALALFVTALAIALSALALGGLVWVVSAARSTRESEIRMEGDN